MGFSLFELLYAWAVRGPLELVKCTWEGEVSETMPAKSIVGIEFVLQIRESLEKYHQLAEENLRQAQQGQKWW